MIARDSTPRTVHYTLPVPSVKDEAVCIRLMDWSETSQIAVLLTRGHGKVSVVAKGARRLQPSTMARFGGGLELLTAGEAVWIAKRGSELCQLTDWDLRDAHRHLRDDFTAFRLAHYAADLLHHLVQDHDPHPKSYAALTRFLADLANPASTRESLLRFQWTGVEDMGLMPVLDRDAETGMPLDESGETLAFSHVAGGVVADTGRGDRWRVRTATVRLLREIAQGGAPIGVDPDSLDRANKLLCAYFRAILDKQLPTMDAVL